MQKQKSHLLSSWGAGAALGFFATWFNRGIRLPAVLGSEDWFALVFVASCEEIRGPEKDVSEAGCETQSSERESNQACAIVSWSGNRRGATCAVSTWGYATELPSKGIKVGSGFGDPRCLVGNKRCLRRPRHGRLLIFADFC
jgi:hypothetical protein